jgi:hypothetical protein
MARAFVNDAGTLRRLTKIFVNDGGVLRRLRAIFVNDGGVLRRVWSAGRITQVESTTFFDSNDNEWLVNSVEVWTRPSVADGGPTEVRLTLFSAAGNVGPILMTQGISGSDADGSFTRWGYGQSSSPYGVGVDPAPITATVVARFGGSDLDTKTGVPVPGTTNYP